MDTKIKNKEDSLAALMTRILKEPLSPIDSSMEEIKESLLEATERIDRTQEAVINNEDSLINIEKYLKREFLSLKSQVLPEQFGDLHKKINVYGEKTNESIQTLEARSNQHTVDLNKLSQSLSEVVSCHHDQQQALAAAHQRQLSKLEESTVRLHTEIKHSTSAFGASLNDSKTLSTTLKENSLTMLASLKNLEQEGHSSLRTVNHNQQQLLQLLTQHNTDLMAYLSAGQSRLKKLTVLMSIAFVLMLSYVGYDIWDKLN